jgi:hypothetical protein
MSDFTTHILERAEYTATHAGNQIRSEIGLLFTEVSSGGLKEELPSLVMKNGSVVEGKEGGEPVITTEPNGTTTASAPSSLPDLPAGTSPNDVEATIHPHPTTDLIKDGKAYPFTASGPADEFDTKAFKQFGTNIIVGRLGTAVKPDNTYDPTPRPLGIVIYNQSAQPKLELTKRAVERIIK